MAARFNLIIFHTPRRESRSDFETIRRNMAVRAPDIEVHILSHGEPAPAHFWQLAAKRPTLIFCPHAVPMPPASVRGARMIPVGLNKFNELRVLKNAGASIPDTVMIEPGTRFDEAWWGPLLVIKPVNGHKGRGISLMRTKDVRWIDTSALPPDHPRHGKKLLAQRFVNTGPFIKSTRVMMVAGRPVYSATSTAVEPQGDPLKSDALEMDIAANGVERIVTLNYDREIIDLAKSIHSKLPDLPSMGIDIVREQDTGKLFALEYNSKGGTWHISSDFGIEQQRKYGLDYKSQFNALGTITDALIEATRKRAV